MEKRPLKQRIRQLGFENACPHLFAVYTKDFFDALGKIPGNVQTDSAYKTFSEDIREDRFLAESVYHAEEDPQRLFKLLVEPFALAAVREHRENRTIL